MDRKNKIPLKDIVPLILFPLSFIVLASAIIIGSRTEKIYILISAFLAILIPLAYSMVFLFNKERTQQKFENKRLWVINICWVGISVGIIASFIIFKPNRSYVIEAIRGSPTPTSELPTLTFYPAQTCPPIPTPATLEPQRSTISPTSTPPPNAVFVPRGGFTIGSDVLGDNVDCAPAYYISNIPDFFIGMFEVTNGDYKQCVDSKSCKNISVISLNPDETYFGNQEFKDYPVVNVTYEQAQSFCIWAGGDLPTEQQWEKAARGATGFPFPWGKPPPVIGQANLAHLNSSYFPAKIGSFNQDLTNGIYDLAGNVSEWTKSWFVSYPNSKYPFDLTNKRRVIRGGSFVDDIDLNYSRLYYRRGWSPDDPTKFLGFRCIWYP